MQDLEGRPSMVGGVDVLRASSMATGVPKASMAGTTRLPGKEDPAISQL